MTQHFPEPWTDEQRRAEAERQLQQIWYGVKSAGPITVDGEDMHFFDIEVPPGGGDEGFTDQQFEDMHLSALQREDRYVATSTPRQEESLIKHMLRRAKARLSEISSTSEASDPQPVNHRRGGRRFGRSAATPTEGPSPKR